MKNLINQIFPPIILNIGRYLKNDIFKLNINKYSHQKFRSWWIKYKQSNKIDKDLILMIDIFISTESFYKVSNYWNYLNRKNIIQLTENGIENFKQTVSTNYSIWVNGLFGGPGKNILKDIKDYKFSVPINQIVKKHELFSIEQSTQLNMLIVLIYNYIIEKYPEICSLSFESTKGNSPFIVIDDKKVTLDLLNSGLEYRSITNDLPSFPNKIIEIGAGSGRNAEFFLKANNQIKYIICDIPPALYVSQYYLTNIFKNKKIFKFRNFNNFNDIKDDFENCDIAFLLPQQLELLPKKYFDIFLAIDCLHEMTPEQISYYFKIANDYSNYIYFKVWKSIKLPFNNIILSEVDYIPLKNWSRVFKRDCYFPSLFFEALYKIN